jgi:hypothetical protein
MTARRPAAARTRSTAGLAAVVLAELYAFFDGAAALLADEAKPAPTNQLKALLRKLQQMTIAADEQINKAVQSCKRARSQRLETMATVMSRSLRPPARMASGLMTRMTAAATPPNLTTFIRR